MPWIDPAELAMAKAADLYSYLAATEPQSMVRSGHDEYRLKDHDSLTVSAGQRKWHWHSRGFGGTTAVQYLVKVCGYSLPDAARMVLDSRAAPTSLPVVRAPPRPLVLPPRHTDNDKVIRYLCGRRGLCREIVEYCIAIGTLYENADYHSCVFVGKDEDGTPRHAAIRATQGDFRQDIGGSDKRFSFALQAKNTACAVLCVYAGAIDALSGASLRQMDGEPWQDRHYLSLAGISPAPVSRYLNRHSGITAVRLCLDNDEAGRLAAERITRILLSRPSLEIVYEPPRSGKDYNEYLRLRMAGKRAKKQNLSRARTTDREF